MTMLARGFLYVVGSAAAFAAAGACLGFAVGRWAPDYYRMVFRLPPSLDLRMEQVGLGLGLVQGLGAGLVVGLALAALSAWSGSRRRAAPSDAAVNENTKG